LARFEHLYFNLNYVGIKIAGEDVDKHKI